MAETLNLLLRPVEINPTVDKASDTRYVFLLRDAAGNEVDLRGFTAKMQLRPYVGAKRLLDELSTEDGRLTLRGSTITIVFPHEDTAQYRFDSAVYDLVITSLSQERYRVAEGRIRFNPMVTQ